MNKIIIAAIVITLAVAGVGTYLYINVNSLVKEGIETSGEQVLGVAVSVEEVQISILSGSGRIKGLRVANPEGYSASDAITVADIQVVLDLSSLTSDKIIVKSVVIDAPSITYETTLLKSNIGELQKRAEAQSANSDSADATNKNSETNLIITNLVIRNSTIEVRTPLLKEPISLKMPVLELNDLGKDEDSSAKEIINKVLVALNKALLPLISENVGLGDQLKDVGEKISEKLKGFFK
ncbi:MAG: hypothetical protein ACI9FB_004544 [Candidatus Azotimanducaceae bacterium]|jgi:hypothetical protein